MQYKKCIYVDSEELYNLLKKDFSYDHNFSNEELEIIGREAKTKLFEGYMEGDCHFGVFFTEAL